MRLVLYFTLSFVAAQTFAASDDEGAFNLIGKTSCGEYVEERKNLQGVHYAQTTSWVTGYLSAYNRLAPATYSILGSTDLKSAMLWLENYCKANPLRDLDDGITSLIRELYPSRHKTRREAGK